MKSWNVFILFFRPHRQRLMCNPIVILSFPKIKFTVRSRVLLEKLIVAQLATSTKVYYHSHSSLLRNQALSLMDPFLTLVPCFAYILNISSHLCLGFPSVVVFQVSRINFYMYVSSRILASICSMNVKSDHF
jgi:hypothetical protein